MKKNKVISIYSGCGGIDQGFHNAGYEIIYATDYWEPACKTLVHNGVAKLVECKDIRNVDFKSILKQENLESIDCLVGGPPCPAYSKSRFYLKDKKRAMEDENSFTLSEYFRAVEETKPKVFFFENVHGFIFKPHQEAFNFLTKESTRLGYKIFYKIVNTAFYGVSQTRERLICIGVKEGLPDFKFPPETHYDPAQYDSVKDKNKKPWVTCGDILADLDIDLPEDEKMKAGSKHKHLLELVPPGDNYLFFTEKRNHPKPIFKWRSRYWSFLLKLSPNRPSWTIQASHSNNMGPFHWKNRFLRIPEIKRIQTFDDNYEISGDFKSQWRQVGNAVPPLLAKIMADEIYQQILNNKKVKKQETEQIAIKY